MQTFTASARSIGRVVAALVLGLAGCWANPTARVANPAGSPVMTPAPVVSPSSSSALPTSAGTASSQVSAAIVVDGIPFGLAFSRGNLWVLVRSPSFAPRASVLTIDPASQQGVGEPIVLEFDPWSIAATDDWVWVAKNGPQKLVQIDANTRQIAASLDVDASLVGADRQGAWVASTGEQANSVVRVDAATHRVTGPPIPVGLEPIQLVTGAGAVWVGSHSAGLVTRIDPATGEVVATIVVGFPVHGLGAGPDAVWAADYHGSKAVRISPATNQVVGEPLPLPFPPYAVAVSATDAWLGVSALGNEADPSDDRVVRIDLATNRIADTLHVGGRPVAMVLGAGELWVATTKPSRVVRIVP
jgi:DNA-binding beta-propeller fold protein YncE